jgi:hypothetical protein
VIHCTLFLTTNNAAKGSHVSHVGGNHPKYGGAGRMTSLDSLMKFEIALSPENLMTRWHCTQATKMLRMCDFDVRLKA